MGRVYAPPAREHGMGAADDDRRQAAAGISPPPSTRRFRPAAGIDVMRAQNFNAKHSTSRARRRDEKMRRARDARAAISAIADERTPT